MKKSGDGRRETVDGVIVSGDGKRETEFSFPLQWGRGLRGGGIY